MKRLAAIPALRKRVPEIERELKRAADPEGVIVGLQRILEAGADPLPHLAGWLRMIDVSPGAVETLVARPALALDIGGHGMAYDRAAFEEGLKRELSELSGLDARLDHLRAVRVDETLRIAWHDVVDGADLTVVTRRISDLAEIVMELVLEEVNEELAKAYGRAWHHFNSPGRSWTRWRASPSGSCRPSGRTNM